MTRKDTLSQAKPSQAKPQVKYALFCQFTIKAELDLIKTDGKPVFFMEHESHRMTGYFYLQKIGRGEER